MLPLNCALIAAPVATSFDRIASAVLVPGWRLPTRPNPSYVSEDGGQVPRPVSPVRLESFRKFAASE